jgi:hypothetical protein
MYCRIEPVRTTRGVPVLESRIAQRFWKSWQLFWAELAVEKPRPSEVTVDSDGRVTQTIKGAMHRDATLDFVCPGCEHEFHETFAWLVKNTSVLCPGGNDTINLHFDQREAVGEIYAFVDGEFDVADK